MEAVSFYVVDF